MRSSAAGLTPAPCGRWCDLAVSALGHPWRHGVSQEVCACQPRAGRPRAALVSRTPAPPPTARPRLPMRSSPSAPSPSPSQRPLHCLPRVLLFPGICSRLPHLQGTRAVPGPACCCLPPRRPRAPGLASSWSRLCPACLSATSGSLAFILRLLLSGPGCRAGRAAPSCLSHPVSLCSSLPASAAP